MPIIFSNYVAKPEELMEAVKEGVRDRALQQFIEQKDIVNNTEERKKSSAGNPFGYGESGAGTTYDFFPNKPANQEIPAGVSGGNPLVSGGAKIGAKIAKDKIFGKPPPAAGGAEVAVPSYGSTEGINASGGVGTSAYGPKPPPLGQGFGGTGFGGTAGTAAGVALGGHLGIQGIGRGNEEKGALGGAIAGASVAGPVGAVIGGTIGFLGAAFKDEHKSYQSKLDGRIVPIMRGDFNKENISEMTTLWSAQATALKQEGLHPGLADRLYGVQAALEQFQKNGNKQGVMDAARNAMETHLTITNGKKDDLDRNLENLITAFGGPDTTGGGYGPVAMATNNVMKRYPWLAEYT